MIAPINVTRLLNGFKVWELAVIHLGAARLLLHKLSHSASQAMRFGFKKLDRCMLDYVPSMTGRASYVLTRFIGPVWSCAGSLNVD